MAAPPLLTPPNGLPIVPGSRPRAGIWQLVAGVGLVVLLAIIGASSAYQGYARRVRTGSEALLVSLARARAVAVRSQLDERIADAQLLAQRAEFRAITIGQPLQREEEAALRVVLRQTSAAYNYHDVALTDATAHTVLQLRPGTLSAFEQQAVERALRTRHPQTTLLPLTAGRSAEYGVAVPIWISATWDAKPAGPPSGVLYLVMDVQERLLPLLRDTLPFASYQGHLLEENTGNAVMLSTTGMSVRSPLQRQTVDSGAARAMIESTSGKDLTGIAVVRGVANVPGTGWYVLTQIARTEAEAPIRYAANAIIAAVLLIAALAGAIARNLWTQQRRRTERVSIQAAERSLRVVQTSMDGFVVFSDAGQIIEANDAFASIVGYSQEELRARRLHDLMAATTQGGADARLIRIQRNGRERFQSQWRTRAGDLLNLDVSATYLPTNDGGQIFAFVRDITQDLDARHHLERINQLYAFLSHTSESLYQASTREEACDMVCRAAIDEALFPLVWIGAVTPGSGHARVLAAHGEMDAAIELLHQQIATVETSALGPISLALRDARPIVVDELLHDPRTTEWQELSRRFGIQSIVAIPVMVEGECVAAIVFHEQRRAAFSADLVTILEEISRMLGLVLQTVTTEERRRRSEERFRNHFESLPIATYVVHEETGQVRRINQAFSDLFGYEIADLPTLDASFDLFFVDPIYRAQTLEVFRNDLKTITSGSAPKRSREYTIRCRNGEERMVQAIVTRTADELIIGWVDLTELRVSQVMLREAQQIARLGSWTYDFRTRQRVVAEELVELFKLDRSIASNGDELLHRAFDTRELRRLRRTFFRAVRDGQLFEYTAPVRTRTGGRRYVLLRARIEYDEDDQPLRAIGSAQDVTTQVEAANELTRYREHLEELVEQRTEALASANTELRTAIEEADAANRAKSAFLAVMSHEIRTPLNGVIGMAEVLAQSPLPARDADAVRTIRTSATNLLGIIDDILDFSKIEAGKVQLDQHETSLRDVLHDVQASLAPVATARRVELTTTVEANVPGHVLTDALRVRQILYNLIGNAIKFSGNREDVRGQVDVQLALDGATTDQRTDALGVLLVITDNGIGMSEETQRGLFTSFTQAELSTTRRFGGTGLGLAIVKRLVEVFGGTVTVRSALGAGTTFTVQLPMQRVHGAASGEHRMGRQTASQPAIRRELRRVVRPVTVEEARANGRLILVAEDDEINQKVIRQQLELLGYAAEIAPNGEEALAMWRAYAYALILTDLHMPRMDGYALTTAIREAEAARGDGHRTPIMALTANALRGEEIRAQEVGMDHYLTKPVLLAVLQEALAPYVPASVDELPPPETPAPPASEQPLDLQVLASLVGDDPGIIREFLEDYQRSAHRLLQEFRQAADASDYRTVGSIAHRLKSSSRTVGALPFGEQCQLMEHAARGDEADGVHTLRGPFEEHAARTLTAIEHVLTQATQ